MNDKKVNVTKAYLPPIDEYVKEISEIWDSHILTNYGSINQKFILKLENYLKLRNLHFVTNGTVALQLSLDAMNITSGEIITTPFTFVATTNSILWQRCKPVFVDINDKDFNIDVNKIEEKITSNTKAILAVHCFGFPCDVKRISIIAQKYNLKVIYDAAHSFGTKLYGKSILSYGDISCCSFHATKVLHSVEGGLCVVNNEKYNKKLNCIKNYGKSRKNNNEYIGINAKNSEFHAAMGVCVLNHFNEIIKIRKEKSEIYKKKLTQKVYIPTFPNHFDYNYIYFPILFKDERVLMKVLKHLNEENIYPRRYFYPCVNESLGNELTPVATEISKRIMCLPLDTYISDFEIEKICKIINDNVE